MLGLGNILLGDDGVGVRVVERLQALYEFPQGTQILDGGTLGLDLLPYLEGADRVLIVDAIDLGAEPGTLARLVGEEVPAQLTLKISPHQMGLADLLAALHLRGTAPSEFVLLGVQPGALEKLGLELSPPVAARVDELADRVLAELATWGIQAARRSETKKAGETPCN